MRQNRGREHQPPLLPSTFRLPSAELRWKAPKRSHFCLFVLFFLKKKKATEGIRIMQIDHARWMGTAINLLFSRSCCCSEIQASVFAAHLITGALPIGLNGCLSVC